LSSRPHPGLPGVVPGTYRNPTVAGGGGTRDPWVLERGGTEGRCGSRSGDHLASPGRDMPSSHHAIRRSATTARSVATRVIRTTVRVYITGP
jgi:hypothetical protein